ncbi:TetR/AcrR family transcriptional regulator [Actinoplanes sp. NPDC051633]|uniref:TetR/AcrR family transcriptional regulator n=1 Tax=Actinoplanes sp. NPDC051633 TaxID=3155670 RepID=UPI0034257952
MTEIDLPRPPWRPAAPQRARAARIPLTRDQIVQAGLRIVTAEGIDAVSMRRLAAEFDTGPSSLYAHVANKDELLQLMFDEICREVPIPEIDPERWQEQIKQIARDGYAAMVGHGDIARAALATIPVGPYALRISEAMLAMMVAGGISPETAGWALDRLFLYITADAYEGAIYDAKFKSAEDLQRHWDEFGEQLARYYEELPEDRFPNLRRHARSLIGGGRESRFEFGLDMLIDGITKHRR